MGSRPSSVRVALSGGVTSTCLVTMGTAGLRKSSTTCGWGSLPGHTFPLFTRSPHPEEVGEESKRIRTLYTHSPSVESSSGRKRLCRTLMGFYEGSLGSAVGKLVR
ncbi:hypothetical protein TNIN_438881 [Trichonephila inaurata madagascariensis]|uniref:Uncharacterized protein n=1 Tax=Trichonephila inaurata madagascariensis TaxID=2747483 RepID=A0A8X7CL69_9ARAC|nr:hypothetical protein TNIN_438881 [Trichonephila inaurata madagascariensis]